MDDRAFEARPGFEDAVARNVVQRPLLRNAFDVELLAVVPVLDNFRRIIVAVSGLNRIPAQASPRRVGLLVADQIGPRAGVVRHLDLSTQIRAVDNVAWMVLAGDKCHRASQGQVHAEANFAIVEEGHFGLGLR